MLDLLEEKHLQVQLQAPAHIQYINAAGLFSAKLELQGFSTVQNGPDKHSLSNYTQSNDFVSPYLMIWGLKALLTKHKTDFLPFIETFEKKP